MRSDDKDELVVVINFANRPLAGRVEVPHDQEFKPVKIAGMTGAPADGFPSFRLSGYDWRGYHRTLKQARRPASRALDEFLTVINFSNRPLPGRVEVPHDQEFKPVKIAGMNSWSCGTS